ncbi:MAG: thioredoxin fold domain-containing protein [Rhizobiales bacterium]|nr:thioredoxin fold domain-containing protein [Hyphomicrobiales bacterium]
MFIKSMIKIALFAATVNIAAALPALASELIMFEQAGCTHCQRWDREVGSLYEKTTEAHMLPLRRLHIREQSQAGITLAAPVRFTPTFVIIDNGKEIGRITGYINDDAFWGLLGTYATKIAPEFQRSKLERSSRI